MVSKRYICSWFRVHLRIIRYILFAYLSVFYRWEKPAGFGTTSSADASAWTAVKDPTSGKTYYYNASTGQTSWEVPAGFNASGNTGDVSTLLYHFYYNFSVSLQRKEFITKNITFSFIRIKIFVLFTEFRDVKWYMKFRHQTQGNQHADALQSRLQHPVKFHYSYPFLITVGYDGSKYLGIMWLSKLCKPYVTIINRK